MRCKQGDLAFFVSARKSRNVGRIVEVMSYVGDHVYAGFVQGKDVWLCKVLGSPMIDMNGVAWTGTVYIDDENLRPIRPDSEPESTDTPRELEAV